MKPAQLATYAVCIALGVGVGYVLNSGDSAEKKDETDAAAVDAEARAAEVAGLQEELAEVRERAARAERDLATARREEEARREAEKAREEEATAAAAAAEAALDVSDDPTHVETEIVFDISDEDPALAEAIAEVDFDVASENVAAMLPLLQQLAEEIGAGKQPSAEVAGGLQRHNGPLVVMAIKLSQGNVPGTGPNGAFTHPAVMVNAIVANLKAIGLPASEEQLKSIRAIGRRFVRKDRDRLAGYPEDVSELEKLIGETDLKTDFFNDVFAALSAEQVEALSPEATRDRVSIDLHSAGLVWSGRVQPIGYRELDALAAMVEGHVTRGIPDEFKDDLKRVVADWVDSLPPALLEYEADTLAKSGMLPMSHVRPCAGETLRLLNNAMTQVALPDEVKARIRQSGGALVFHRLPDAEE